MTLRSSRWAAIVVALLAFASSISGIVNGFTYDDRYVIELNPVSRTLHQWWNVFASSYWPPSWGGDGYRPLTILAFKIEYAIGGGKPLPFHATNIALYMAASVLVFFLARRVLGREHAWAAWLAAALFAVHPVHVEAVANIVGQSELLVALALIAATLLYLRDRMTGPLTGRTGMQIVGLYAIACFFKEHGIVLPAILGAAELTLITDATRWRERVRRIRPFYLVLVLVAVTFVAMRSRVLAGHSLGGFQPFTPFSTLHISNTDRVLTALGVVPQWIRLLYWPARLSPEYGPPDLEISQGPSITQLPGLALLLAILSLGVILRRRHPVVSFGIAFTCIALLPSSNFLLPAGILLAERTLFLPSVGAMLVVGGVAVSIARLVHARFGDRRAPRLAGQSVVAALLITGATRSGIRSTVWHDNERLFRQAVLDSPFAYRAHYMLGSLAFQNQRKREGEAEFRRALNLFPYDPFLSYSMAEQYRTVGLCAPAIPLYRWSLGLDPEFPLGRSAFAWCLLREGQYEEARTRALDAIRHGATYRPMHDIIREADKAIAERRRGASSAATKGSKVPGKVP